jgi:enoyl-CoA hydratase/carnithine racemase
LSETSAPKAIAASKRLVYDHLGKGYLAALRETELVQNDFVSAPDSTEGAQAFIERRNPVFDRVGNKE